MKTHICSFWKNVAAALLVMDCPDCIGRSQTEAACARFGFRVWGLGFEGFRSPKMDPSKRFRALG